MMPSTLHEEFRTAIRDGDERLRELIEQQIAFVIEGLKANERLCVARSESADKLELERIAKVLEQLKGNIAVLERGVEEGDTRLREHIDAQYGQINAALDSARRETAFAASSSEKAIAKAETATEERFRAANAWREQSVERERTQREEIAKLSATFLPREVADSQWERITAERDATRQRIAAVEANIANLIGHTEGEGHAQQKIQPWALWVAGAILTVVLALTIFVANLAITPS